MAGVKVTVSIRKAKVQRVLNDVTDASARRAAYHVARRASVNVITAGRVRTGALAGSFYVKKSRNPSPISASYTVGSHLKYSGYQEKGIAGSRARVGSVLAFMPKGSATVVFAKHTRGFKGAHFLENAASSLTARDFLP